VHLKTTIPIALAVGLLASMGLPAHLEANRSVAALEHLVEQRTSLAKGAARSIENSPILYVHYEVLVEGNGSSTKPQQKATWIIKRKYSCNLELTMRQVVPAAPVIKKGMTMAQQQAVIKEAMKPQNSSIHWYVKFNKNSLYRPLIVDINDILRVVDEEPGGGEMDPLTTTATSTWKCNAVIKTSAMAQVILDRKTKTLNVRFSLMPVDNEKRLLKTSELVYDPESESNKNKTTTNNVGAESVASVSKKGLFENWLISHARPRPVKFSDSIIKYDSGPLTLDKPLFNQERTKDEKVRLRVRYTIKSTL
jgi:hypothetical protein